MRYRAHPLKDPEEGDPVFLVSAVCEHVSGKPEITVATVLLGIVLAEGKQILVNETGRVICVPAIRFRGRNQTSYEAVVFCLEDAAVLAERLKIRLREIVEENQDEKKAG